MIECQVGGRKAEDILNVNESMSCHTKLPTSLFGSVCLLLFPIDLSDSVDRNCINAMFLILDTANIQKSSIYDDDMYRGHPDPFFFLV